LAGIFVIAGAAVALLGRGGGAGDEPAAEQPDAVATAGDRETIAVLPFDNLSPDAGDAHFADGMHDEIRVQLAKGAALKVTSRTSVMGYKAETRNVREIAQELEVRNIVEGTVRRAGDHVRITAQLIDAEADAHVWAESYNREVSDIFAIQSEVAQQVVAALRVSLTESERERMEVIPTDDMEAYQYYVRGHEHLKPTSELPVAERFYAKAVELDPTFAEAWARLSMVRTEMYQWGFYTSDIYLLIARLAADSALRLDPSSPGGHLAWGDYYYWARPDNERALEHYRNALALEPSSRHALWGLGVVKRRVGDWDGAVENLRAALDLDPLQVGQAWDLGVTLWAVGQFAEAAELYRRAIDLEPQDPFLYADLAQLYVSWKGDTVQARQVMDEGIGKADTLDSQYVGKRIYLDVLRGDYNAAMGRVEHIRTKSSYHWWYGVLYRLLDRPEASRAHLDSARAVLEANVTAYPGQPALPDFSRPEMTVQADIAQEDHVWQLGPRPWDVRSALGAVYAALGHSQEAVQEGELATELLPTSEDACDGPMIELRLAAIYTMIGQHDAAIDILERLLGVPARPDWGTRPDVQSGVTVPKLRLEPIWDPLRDHPRFQALLAK
jgi:serine/threonine-protein kinase